MHPALRLVPREYGDLRSTIEIDTVGLFDESVEHIDEYDPLWTRPALYVKH